MDILLRDKKINSVVFILLVIISLFFIVKFINEIKTSKYIGYDSQYPNVIYVSGKGEVKAISDIASLNINLSKEGETSKEAQGLLNDEITKTLDYLKLQKIEDKDIKSEYGGLIPKYSYNRVACYTYPCPPKEQKIIGYTATQSIAIKVREVDNANEIRTGLSELGITDISGPTFSIDDKNSYKNQARSMAITEAKDKAGILAQELGIKLGKIINFSENNDNSYPTAYRSEMMMDSISMKSAPVPELPKGENTIISNVTITYEIR